MITRRGLIVFASVSATSGCASPGMPPGGPIDTEGPRVIAFSPDSGRVNVKPPAVIFKFDEVVSERPAGAAGLDALFLISPRDGVPNVAWHRGEVAVKPRRGWRSNTAYTVTLLPGITDLRGNVRNTGKITIFSTGPEIPKSRVIGTVFNWITGSVAQRALVEARPITDTTVVFVAAADSTGSFIFPNLPPGRYRLRGLIDENNNKGLDQREPWDTTTVALTDSARVELMAFAHDSVAPRLTDVVMRDAATLELLFDRAIDPKQRFTPASIEMKRSDSTVIPILAVEQGGGRRDTAFAAGPAPSRGIPSTSLIARLGVAIREATTMRVRAIGIRSLDGVAKTTEKVATVDPNPPEKTPPPRTPAGVAAPTRRPPPPPPTPPPASPARVR